MTKKILHNGDYIPLLDAEVETTYRRNNSLTRAK